MKYGDKLKPLPSKQKSNTDFYESRFETRYICPVCGQTYKEYEYSYKKLCCGTSIQKVLK